MEPEPVGSPARATARLKVLATNFRSRRGPLDLGGGLADLAAAAEQVQVPDAQRHRLAGAKPGRGGEGDQELVARVDDGGQVLDLPGGQEVHGPADDARQRHPGRRVAGDRAALHTAARICEST